MYYTHAVNKINKTTLLKINREEKDALRVNEKVFWKRYCSSNVLLMDAVVIQRPLAAEYFALTFDMSNDANQTEDKELIAATRTITLGLVTLILHDTRVDVLSLTLTDWE